MKFYGKRKKYLEGVLGAEAAKLSNQARFILEKCSNQLTIENKKKKVNYWSIIFFNLDKKNRIGVHAEQISIYMIMEELRWRKLSEKREYKYKKKKLMLYSWINDIDQNALTKIKW